MDEGRQPGVGQSVSSDVLERIETKEDREQLPAWWRRAIEHFEANDLRTYKPPILQDGTIKKIVEDELEEKYDISITVQCQNATVGDDWTVLIDGTEIGTIGRYRSREGYTVFEMDEGEFRSWIERSVQDV